MTCLLNMTIKDSFILKAFADYNSNVFQIIGLTINKLNKRTMMVLYRSLEC